MKLAVIIASLLFPVAAQACCDANQNLVKDGSFENVSVGTGGWSVFDHIDGWKTSSGAGIEVQDHVAGSPKFGDQFVELDSHNNSSMYQTVHTVVGHLYMLSFWYSARPGTVADTNGLHVGAGNLNFNLLPGAGGNDTQWKQSISYFKASDWNTRLSFGATGQSDGLGTYIDNVQLNCVPVPEPETYALMGLGLVGLLAARRRKAKP